MKRFGTEYGGFYYPENLYGLDSNNILVGAGEDISHDIVLAALDSKVYIIDPTPKAIEHCNYVKNILDGKENLFMIIDLVVENL